MFVGERLAFWSINRAHQSDIGGATHGAYNPGATEIWQEGIRIPPLKLYDAGTLRDDVMDMIATNVRHPATSWATSGPCWARRAWASAGSSSWWTTTASRRPRRRWAKFSTAPSARAARASGQWKDGVYRGLSVLDDDGHGIENIQPPRHRDQEGRLARSWT